MCPGVSTGTNRAAPGAGNALSKQTRRCFRKCWGCGFAVLAGQKVDNDLVAENGVCWICCTFGLSEEDAIRCTNSPKRETHARCDAWCACSVCVFSVSGQNIFRGISSSSSSSYGPPLAGGVGGYNHHW